MARPPGRRRAHGDPPRHDGPRHRRPSRTDPAAYDRLEDDLLDRFPDEPVDAIGFSHGARTLLTIAMTHPDRFHSLVVAGVGTNLFRPAGQVSNLGAVFDGSVEAEDPTMQLLLDPGATPPTRTVTRWPRWSGDPNPIPLTDEGLAAITCPVLVVIGDNDFAGPADPLVEKLPDARLVILRNVDHFATPKDFGFIDATPGVPRRRLLTWPTSSSGSTSTACAATTPPLPRGGRRATGASTRATSPTSSWDFTEWGLDRRRVRAPAPGRGARAPHVPHHAGDPGGGRGASGACPTPACGSASSPTAST